MSITLTVETIDELFRHIETRAIVDQSFQRESVWGLAQKRNWIDSVLNGRAITPLVFADIESAIKASAQKGDACGEAQLQTQYDNGERYSVLDGQNRMATIKEFMNDGFTISGTFADADRKEMSCNNVFFSDLSTRLKDKFLGVSLGTTYLFRRGYEEMAEIFLNLQEGEPPTSQEKRHAINSPFKFYISGIREKFRSMFERIETVKKKLNRKKDEEVLSKAIMTLIPSRREKSCGQSDLDKFYSLGKGRLDCKSVPEYEPKELKRAVAILELVSSSIIHNKVHSTQVAERQFWALVIACEYLYDNNLDIEDGKWDDFYHLVHSLDRRLCNSSKEEQAKDAKEAETLGEKDPPDNQYYWWRASAPHLHQPRLSRKKTLIDSFENALPQTFVLTSDKEVYSLYEEHRSALFSN